MTFKNNQGFSIMGVLVASAIGIIVITGLTKLFVHMNTQLNLSEQKAQRTNLMSLIGSYLNSPNDCKETLSAQAAAEISAGTDKSFGQILTRGGGTVIDLSAEAARLKTQYGMEGYLVFQLKCEETTTCAKCASPPCNPKRWSLSLISQTSINGVPSFNQILKLPLIVRYTGPNDEDFQCNQVSTNIDLTDALCSGSLVLKGFDTNGNKICVTN